MPDTLAPPLSHGKRLVRSNFRPARP